MSELKQRVLASGDIEVLEEYAVTPILRVRLTSQARALRALNLAEVLSITSNGANRHWLGNSLPLISQPAVAATPLTGQCRRRRRAAS
jgi:hypothetical protein